MYGTSKKMFISNWHDFNTTGVQYWKSLYDTI